MRERGVPPLPPHPAAEAPGSRQPSGVAVSSSLECSNTLVSRLLLTREVVKSFMIRSAWAS